MIAGDPIATIVYRHAQHVVSLMAFVKRLKLPATSTIAGFHVRSWPEGGLTYVAASDIPERELATLRMTFGTPLPKHAAAVSRRSRLGQARSWPCVTFCAETG